MKNRRISVLPAVLLTALVWFAMLLTGLTPLVILPLSFLVYLYASGARTLSLGTLVFFALFLAFGKMPKLSALLFCLYGIPTVVAGECLIRRKSVSGSILTLVAVFLVLLGVTAALCPRLIGTDLPAWVTEQARSYMNTDTEQIELLNDQLFQYFEQMGLTLDAATTAGKIEQFLALFETAVRRMIPAALFAVSISMGFLIYALPSVMLRHDCKREKPRWAARVLGFEQPLMPMLPPMERWQLPNYVANSLIGLTAVAFIGSFTGSETFLICQTVSSVLMMLCFGAQGAALIRFLFTRRWHMAGWAQALLIVIAILFLPTGLMLCGLGDHLFRFRRIFSLKDGQGPRTL